jgi:predicted transcriptional regulator
LSRSNQKDIRVSLRLSQSGLSRISGVRRVRICLHELGDIELTLDEQRRIFTALKAEAERLRTVSASFEGTPASPAPEHSEQLEGAAA